jgi:hypothetical protein
MIARDCLTGEGMFYPLRNNRRQDVNQYLLRRSLDDLRESETSVSRSKA